MTELFIPNRYAKVNQTDAKNVKESGVRAYRHSPDTVALQIRVKGDKIARFAHVSLSLDEAKQLAAHLSTEAD